MVVLVAVLGAGRTTYNEVDARPVEGLDGVMHARMGHVDHAVDDSSHTAARDSPSEVAFPGLHRDSVCNVVAPTRPRSDRAEDFEVRTVSIVVAMDNGHHGGVGPVVKREDMNVGAADPNAA